MPVENGEERGRGRGRGREGDEEGRARRAGGVCGQREWEEPHRLRFVVRQLTVGGIRRRRLLNTWQADDGEEAQREGRAGTWRRGGGEGRGHMGGRGEETLPHGGKERERDALRRPWAVGRGSGSGWVWVMWVEGSERSERREGEERDMAAAWEGNRHHPMGAGRRGRERRRRRRKRRRRNDLCLGLFVSAVVGVIDPPSHWAQLSHSPSLRLSLSFSPASSLSSLSLSQ